MHMKMLCKMHGAWHLHISLQTLHMIRLFALVAVGIFGVSAEKPDDTMDVFSSTSATVGLYELRHNLTDVLHEYIAAERDRLNQLEYLTTQLTEAVTVSSDANTES